MEKKDQKKNKDILLLATKRTEERIRVEYDSAKMFEMKDNISNTLMKQFDLEEQLKELSKSYKEKIDAFKKIVKRDLKSVRNGFTDEVMNVINVPNEEELSIEFYTEEGEKVGVRRMTSEERPSITFPMAKAGT